MQLTNTNIVATGTSPFTISDFLNFIIFITVNDVLHNKVLSTIFISNNTKSWKDTSQRGCLCVFLYKFAVRSGNKYWELKSFSPFHQLSWSISGINSSYSCRAKNKVNQAELRGYSLFIPSILSQQMTRFDLKQDRQKSKFLDFIAKPNKVIIFFMNLSRETKQLGFQIML